MLKTDKAIEKATISILQEGKNHWQQASNVATTSRCVSMNAYYAWKGEIWKAIDSAIVESSSRILGT